MFGRLSREAAELCFVVLVASRNILIYTQKSKITAIMADDGEESFASSASKSVDSVLEETEAKLAEARRAHLKATILQVPSNFLRWDTFSSITTTVFVQK